MWKLLQDPKKRAALAFAGAGLAALAGGGWAVFTYVWPKPDRPGPAVTVCGNQGVAAGGNLNMTGSQITSSYSGGSASGACSK